MKRLFYLAMVFGLLLSLAPPALAGPVIGTGQDGGPPPRSPDGPTVLFVPLLRAPKQYTIEGQVKDAGDAPLSGVVVSSDSGKKTTTDADGVYSMKVLAGQRVFSASKSGYKLDPKAAAVNVKQDMHNLNFSAAAACINPVPNGDFETWYYYWNPISGNANGFTPVYSTEQANSGTVSGKSGIPASLPSVNRVSWSRWRSHEFIIPAAATSADVSMFVWPRTSESIVLARETPRQVGFDTESPDAPFFPGDMQYIAVIDKYNHVLGWIWDARWNDQAWITTGTLSMLAYAGHEVKLEFGTYNDGLGGVTSAYFDDVVVNICSDDITLSGCDNILLNSELTDGGGGWTISPANIPSVYTTQYFFSGPNSMQNGVPVGAVNPFPFQWTTSEFWQPTTIPVPVNAYYARLKMRLLPRSTDLWGFHLAEQAALDKATELNASLAAESQYGHIRDTANTATLRLLFSWFPCDSYNWLYREFDLLDFRGQSIAVLFGAANDGWDGNTALYVDDVYLEVCAP